MRATIEIKIHLLWHNSRVLMWPKKSKNIQLFTSSHTAISFHDISEQWSNFGNAFFWSISIIHKNECLIYLENSSEITAQSPIKQRIRKNFNSKFQRFLCPLCFTIIFHEILLSTNKSNMRDEIPRVCVNSQRDNLNLDGLNVYWLSKLDILLIIFTHKNIYRT